MIATLYPLGGLFFYRLIFMAWLLCAEGMFYFHFPRKRGFAWKLPLAIFACFLFAFIFPIPTSDGIYSMLMFFCFFAFSVGAACFLFKCDFKMILFSAIAGYTTEHIAYEIYFALTNYFAFNPQNYGGMYSETNANMFSGMLDELFYFASYIVIYWLMFVLFARKINGEQEFPAKSNIKMLVLSALFLIIDIFVNSLSANYGKVYYEHNYMAIIALINALCCIVGFLFLYEMFYANHIRREYEIMQEIRKEENSQYQISKETIDLINVKCHDLRHQIRQIGNEGQVDAKTIEGITKIVNIYDASIKTSNQALNVILSEKSLFCSKNGIKFSCIADGSLLDFMSEEDIYSLFGNIIDNAIQAVRDLEDDKKIITIRIHSVGNMISISERNSYSGDIRMVNGLPKTSSVDEAHHGFGMKSIKMVTEKYKGTFQIKADKQIFSISILFLNETKK